MSDNASKYTAKNWDEVRSAFSASLMVDTSLDSLAQNLDGPEWPIKGKDESPAKYIDLAYTEMKEMLALKGYPNHADLLISILKETMAFDAPFGDMVEQTQASAQKDNQMLKNMAKLGIPESFPIELTALDSGTIDFCAMEKLTTLGEFAVFAQGMSQNVIVGGDFKKLLNALSHIDEKALAELLPFRPGATGMHLIESLAQIARVQDPAAKSAKAAKAFAMFKDEHAAIQRDLASGLPLTRILMVLGNPAAEAAAAEMLEPEAKAKTGFMGSLSRWFKKK
ncbi:MAG: hypothetical protein IPN11_14960 [Opitutaceae bacterium]|nr:hypothetical protein [Opitutaceae bacterium]